MKRIFLTLTLLALVVLAVGCTRKRLNLPEDRSGIDLSAVATKASEESSNDPLVNIADSAFKSYLLSEVVYSILPDESAESVASVTKLYDTAYLATVQRIDANGDGEISVAEAERVVFLKINGLNIKSFAGLEYFSNLTGLIINEVDSPRLDLSGNAKLNYLDCSRSNLSALDLSKNGELKFLNCKMNRLATLYLSNNPKLRVLHCGGNQLPVLDLTKSRSLTRFSCENNQLASLDLSNNIELVYVDCSSNQLTSLDVSKSASLTSLYCDYNPLMILYVAAGHKFNHLSNPEATTIVNK